MPSFNFRRAEDSGEGWERIARIAVLHRPDINKAPRAVSPVRMVWALTSPPQVLVVCLVSKRRNCRPIQQEAMNVVLLRMPASERSEDGMTAALRCQLCASSSGVKLERLQYRFAMTGSRSCLRHDGCFAVPSPDVEAPDAISNQCSVHVGRNLGTLKVQTGM